MADLSTNQRKAINKMCPVGRLLDLGTRVGELEDYKTDIQTIAIGKGAALVALLDAAERYDAINVEGGLAEIAGAGRLSTDTVRSARKALVNEITATTTIRENRVVSVDSGGHYEESNGHDNTFLGVNNSGGSIAGAAAGDITVSGEATVTAGPQSVALLARLAAVPEGLVSTFLDVEHSLMSAVATNGSTDEFTANSFAATETVEVRTSVDDAGDRSQDVTVIGIDGSGDFLSETIATDAADSSVWMAGTALFAEVFAVITAWANTQAVEVKNTTSGTTFCTTGTGAATTYGDALTDDSDDAKGHGAVIWADGAVTEDVMVVGTDGAGAAQYEVVTMNGATRVQLTKAWNTITAVYAGADDAAGRAYSIAVEKDTSADFAGFAWEAITHDTTGEAALAPGARWAIWLKDLLASVLNGEGASLLGLEDVAGYLDAVNVEAAIAEILIPKTTGQLAIGALDAHPVTGTWTETIASDLPLTTRSTAIQDDHLIFDVGAALRASPTALKGAKITSIELKYAQNTAAVVPGSPTIDVALYSVQNTAHGVAPTATAIPGTYDTNHDDNAKRIAQNANHMLGYTVTTPAYVALNEGLIFTVSVEDTAGAGLAFVAYGLVVHYTFAD